MVGRPASIGTCRHRSPVLQLGEAALSIATHPTPFPQALVLDAPVISFLVSTMNDQCDLYAVGEPFETFDIAIGFPPDAPDTMVSNISKIIVALQVCACLLPRGWVTVLYTRWHSRKGAPPALSHASWGFAPPGDKIAFAANREL